MIAPSPNKPLLSFGYHVGYPLNGGNHKGQDFAYDPNHYVYMPEDGIVTCIVWDGKTYEGNVIYIQVGNRRHALCHLSQFLVNSGEMITQGQRIGVQGDTGFAQGKHLHWAVTVGGKLVDPMSLITKEEDMPIWNDGDIVNAKRAETGVPTYQPSGPELDYYKQPEHEKDLLYQTIAGMQVQIDKAKQGDAVVLKPGKYQVK